MIQSRCEVNQLNLELFSQQGAASAVWVVAWIFLAFDRPSRHPRITDIEREYIEHGTRKSEAPNKVKLKCDIEIQWYIFTSYNSRRLFYFESVSFTCELRHMCYRSLMKLREGNDFTHVCQSTVGVYPSMHLGRGCILACTLIGGVSQHALG